MKKLAVILALMFGASGVVLAADAPTGATTASTKTEVKAKHAKKVHKTSAKQAKSAKMEADKK